MTIARTPYNVSWLLTNNCNYDCGFCWRVLDRKNIRLPEALSITENLAEAGMRKMSWAGGEPLLFRGIEELIKRTSGLGVETMLITNGSLIDRVFAKGLPDELDWLTLPLEGIGEFINIAVGRQAGHYDRVQKLIERYRSTDIKIKINSVATSKNLSNLLEIPEYLNDWGVQRWKVFQFYPIRGFATINSVDYQLGNEAFERFREQLEERCAALGVQSQVVIESTDDLDNSYYTLSPDGCVYVSQQGSDIYLGDLTKDDPDLVFSDPRLDKLKYETRSAWILQSRAHKA